MIKDRSTILEPLSKEFEYPQHDDVILSGESVDPNDTINLSKALGFRPQQNTPGRMLGANHVQGHLGTLGSVLTFHCHQSFCCSENT